MRGCGGGLTCASLTCHGFVRRVNAVEVPSADADVAGRHENSGTADPLTLDDSVHSAVASDGATQAAPGSAKADVLPVADTFEEGTGVHQRKWIMIAVRGVHAS